MKFEIDLDKEKLDAHVASHIKASLNRELKKSNEWVRARVREEICRQIEAAVLAEFPTSSLGKEVEEVIASKKTEAAQLTAAAMARVKKKLAELEEEIDRIRPRQQFERSIDNHLQWAVFRALGLPYHP